MSDYPHERCEGEIRDRLADLGCEVTISTSPPLVMNPYVEAMTCPHGTTFYFEPTSDQRAAWARDGVK